MTAAPPATKTQLSNESSERIPERAKGEWLGVLTSVRFFAAVIVVCVHSRPLMPEWIQPHLDQAGKHAVTLFFVLSGFVLAYNYRDLASNRIFDFYRARIARIYPIHWLTLAIVFCIQAQGLVYPQVLAANALLLQDWFPAQALFFSYNSPSWSLSCELFFYLIFPFLINSFATTWKKKLVGAVSVAVLISVISQILVQKPSTDLWANDSYWFWYCCPLTRLAEFVIGMVAAFAFLNLRGRYLSLASATAIELGLCASYIGLCSVQKTFGQGQFSNIDLYLMTSGAAPLFGLVVMILALGQGLLSKILSSKVLVYLGELSLGVYLLHVPILGIFNILKPALRELSTDNFVTLVWLSILAISALCRELLEVPARKLIKGQPLAKPLLRTSMIVAIALCICSAVVVIVEARIDRKAYELHVVNEGELARLKKTSLMRTGVVHVGTSLILESINFRQAIDGGAGLVLTWRNARQARLNKSIAVHLYDKNLLMVTKDFVQAPANLKLADAQVWSDSVFISAEELKRTSAVYVGVYTRNPVRMEPVVVDGAGPSALPFIKVEKPFFRQ
jgi:peptidoglycan/LPS O-acetylase OafA/YrhL